MGRQGLARAIVAGGCKTRFVVCACVEGARLRSRLSRPPLFSLTGRERAGVRGSAKRTPSADSRVYFAISLAAAIAAPTPDFFRIALILARDPLERFRRAAIYRP